MLESILKATFGFVKFADDSDAIFPIMANALRFDFYWRLTHDNHMTITINYCYL